MMNHLNYESMMNNHMTPREIQVYANEEEQEEMKLCHRKSIILIADYINCFILPEKPRALEVAAGDGILSADLLKDHFAEIDCFD